MTTKITLNDVRFSFPVLGEPKPASEDKPNKLQYSLSIILAKDHPQLAALNAIIDGVCEAKWPGKGKAVRKAADSMGKIILRDGNSKDEDKYPQYQGMYFINARLDADKGKPRIFGLGGMAAGVQPANTVYSGSYGRVVLDFYAYGGQNGIPKGVSCSLGDVQFTRDGDAFGATAPKANEDDFGAVEAEQGVDPLMA